MSNRRVPWVAAFFAGSPVALVLGAALSQGFGLDPAATLGAAYICATLAAAGVLRKL
jgi:hypothetical protein